MCLLLDIVSTISEVISALSILCGVLKYILDKRKEKNADHYAFVEAYLFGQSDYPKKEYKKARMKYMNAKWKKRTDLQKYTKNKHKEVFGDDN